MLHIKKKQNNYTEEHFHDEWARSISIEEIDIKSQFEGDTSPEYKEAINQLGNVQGKTILNIGCGLGEEAVYLASKGAKVIALDISSEMLNFTKKLARKYKVDNITYHQMASENTLFKDASFDYIFGCNILHHVNIDKAIREAKRLLKPSGIAVFVEPLSYNPIINVYRIIASKVRTDHEHPLSNRDMKIIKKAFPNMQHKELQLFTLLIFVWFFLVERLHPNKTRYWKKIITEAEKYRVPFTILFNFDKVMLKFFPFLRRYCWITVIKVQK